MAYIVMALSSYGPVVGVQWRALRSCQQCQHLFSIGLGEGFLDYLMPALALILFYLMPTLALIGLGESFLVYLMPTLALMGLGGSFAMARGRLYVCLCTCPCAHTIPRTHEHGGILVTARMSTAAY